MVPTCKNVAPYSPTSLNVGTMVNAPQCNSLYLFLSFLCHPYILTIFVEIFYYCNPGGAAAHAEEEKAKKYAHLDSMYLFQPVALETCGTIGPKSRDFLRELGQWLKMVTGEARSCTFLLQRISIAIQVGNAASVIASLPDSANVDISFDL